MPSPTPRTTTARLTGAALGVALALAIPATTAISADAEDGQLCDAVNVEAINAIGPLQFALGEVGFPGFCVLEATSGTGTLTLGISGFSFDLLRSSEPDAPEFSIADRPAIVADGTLHVGLDEGILSVIPDGLDAGAAGLDAIEYAIDIAEVVVPALATQASPDGDPVAGGSLVPPPDVAGISWRSRDVQSGAELMADDEQQAAVWQPLLDAAGVEATQFFLLDATPSDAESGERIGSYAAIQLVGTDAARLRSAIIDWLRTVRGDVVVEDATIGGKAVAVLSAEGEILGYLYVIGDVAHSLTMPEESAARVLEALP